MKIMEDATTTKTRTITDSQGNQYTINSETREIISKRDKHGFIYDSQGKRVGNVFDHHFIEGYHYD